MHNDVINTLAGLGITFLFGYIGILRLQSSYRTNRLLAYLLIEAREARRIEEAKDRVKTYF